MSKAAPLWICFLPQLVSVTGDCIGQRTARTYMTNSSRRRFVLGLVMVSSVQMFVVLTIIQLALPATTTIIYETGGRPSPPVPSTPNGTNSSAIPHAGGGKKGGAYDWCSTDLRPATANNRSNGSIGNVNNYKYQFDEGGDDNALGVSSAQNGGDDFQPTASQDKYCFDQGPLSIFKNLRLCPMLLLNGVVNIFYYMGEAALYKQPLGVLLLVLTALASSFFIAPVQEWFQLSGATPVNVWAVLCGLFGAILCLIERDPPKWKNEASSEQKDKNNDDNTINNTSIADDGDADEEKEKKVHRTSANEDDGGAAPSYSVQADTERRPLMTLSHSSRSVTSTNASELPTACGSEVGGDGVITSERRSGEEDVDEPLIVVVDNTPLGRVKRGMRIALSHLPLIGPFTILSFAIVLYFVLMKYFNDTCHINMWGYNAFDQVVLPFFIYPTFVVIDLIKPAKRVIEEDGIDQEESFREAFIGMLHDLFIRSRGVGFAHMFAYRLLINSRAMGYSYIAIVYNLTDSYLELTLIRVILSWMASAVVILLVPSFIQAAKKEREKIMDKVNVVLKVVGTAAIVGSLIILNNAA